MIFFLILIFFSCEFQLYGMDPLTVSKISHEKFFSLSLIPPHKKLEIPIINTPLFAGSNPYNFFLTIAPQIGHYDEQYPLRPLLGIIQLPREFAATTIPDSIKNVVYFLNDVTRLDYTISFWGPYLIPPSKPKKAKYIIDEWYTNLVFHPWARTWAMDDPSAVFKPSGQDIFFNATIPMGIFQADGISPVLEKRGVAFDNLTPQAISVHGASAIPDPKNLLLMFSPANAYFLIDKQRAVSNFWAVAHSPNKKYVCISYVILINSENAKNKLEDVFSNSITLGDFINNLRDAAEKFDSPDNEALKKIAQSIGIIVKNERVPLLPESPRELIKTIAKLIRSLEQLKKFL